MKLKDFRITNYRGILDSGEVEVGDYVALVGKNESGRTTALKALHKFNPARAEAFSGLKEFPRRKFHAFKGNEPVTTITFKLGDDERDDLKKIHPKFQVTQDYSSNRILVRWLNWCGD